MIILTVGISGSGKSTYAKWLCHRHKNFREINRDDIRSKYAPNLHTGDCSMYYNSPNLNEMEIEVDNILWATLREYTSDGLGVIISDTNLNRCVRQRFISYANEYKIKIECHPISVDLNIAIERNKNRLRKVPNDVILKQYNMWIKYLKFDKDKK